MGAGADVNLRSDWQNGPYTVLDNTDEDTARWLLERGATLTPNVAARLGWLDDLRRVVDADPSLVHARGGDGQQPLHEAKTADIADWLLDRGAGIDVRCLDHQSTPAQYALADRPDVCRRLLARGATPDIFMAARLGDAALTTRLLDADPACAAARINKPGYAAVPPFNIYCWSLGFGLSPHAVATRFGHADVHALLASRSPARVRFLDALLAADEPAAKAVIAEDPSLVPSLTRHEHGHLAHAIFHELYDAADLMLRLGFDPSGPGIDGGTALHAACWVGSVRMVDRLLAHGGVPLDARDPLTRAPPRLGRVRLGASPRARRRLPRRRRPSRGRGSRHHCGGQRRRQDAAGDGHGERDDAGGAAPPRRAVAPARSTARTESRRPGARDPSLSWSRSFRTSLVHGAGRR